MDNPRIYLWIALAALAWLNLVQWNRDFSRPAGTTIADTGATSAASPSSPAPASNGALPSLPAAPSASTPTATPSTQAGSAPALPGNNQAVDEAPRVRVVTDVLDLDLSLKGGDIVRADLPRYPRDKSPGSPPVRLLELEAGDYSVIRSGLRAAAGRAEPTHLVRYQSAAAEYRLAPGAQELRVPLTWTDGQALTVNKIFIFRPGRYDIELDYEVDNQTATEWQGASYVQFARHIYPRKRSMFDVESYAYRGPAIYDGAKYRKLDVDDEDDAKFTQTFSGGWMAEMRHHFVSAAVPPIADPYDYTLSREGDHSLISYRGPLKTVAPYSTSRFTEKLFVGPKLQEQLKTLGPKLERTADYGKLTILAEPLFWLLQKVHALVGNWGWAIIIVTVLLKLLFYKLTETSGRSMAKMRTIAPRIKNIQERYKDDREQLAKQMMELYKREKINPVAGCLPIVVQIPVFLAFYWVLLESVEMRQAPFMGWIQDLSSKDPFFVLPILMGAAMFGQFKLNPQPPDPVQAKVFAFMPVVMTVMMAWFPAGLVLYWLTNTLLSIAQQWKINKVVAAAEAKKS
jgi:YidC/Oxa1 family membrane protein insertase